MSNFCILFQIYIKFVFYKKIYRYLRFNSNDEETAKDLCQETFVRAFRSIKNFVFKKDWSIQAFLFRISRNLLIDQSRRKKEYKIEQYEHIESSEDLFEEAQRSYDVKKTRLALKKLTEEERQIIILRYFEEMDTKEIANIVGIKDGAIRVRIHRTLQKLKDIVEIYDRRTN